MQQSIPRSTITWLGASALGLLLAACGSSDSSSTASGQAVTDTPTAGTVTLVDSSAPSQTRTSALQVDGTYGVKVDGLTPPYLLRVEWTDPGGARQLYGVSEGNENLDVNGITDAAYGSACGTDGEDHVFRSSDSDQKRGAATKARALLAKLMRGPLGPLFARYGITDLRADRDAVRALLADVSFVRHDGVVTVANRATGGVIFVGQLEHLDAGVFTAANMPPGPGASSCTAFTYSAFGDCQPGNSQTRTVLTSSPAGCTGGSPLLSQACTYVPPVTTCTAFTYSAFAACQPDNTQTRTVLTSSPAGCTGGAPVLSQACVFVPACTLATATPSCSTCHGTPGTGTHASRPLTCANCHGPVNNGAGTPSTGMAAALVGTACRLTYPTSGTHNDGTINFGAAQ
jgi:hypothetical protein